MRVTLCNTPFLFCLILYFFFGVIMRTVNTLKDFDAALEERSYSRVNSDGTFAGWNVKRLWQLSKTLPVENKPIQAFQEAIDKWISFDSVEQPDGRMTASIDIEHFYRIKRASLKYPIILDMDGRIMDGMHRLMKTYLSDRPIILVVQFTKTPEPDVVYIPKNKSTHLKLDW